jgi:hypothetical protein
MPMKLKKQDRVYPIGGEVIGANLHMNYILKDFFASKNPTAARACPKWT